jgi:peptidoglycan/LPS O-acetylase OafA/YrhL
MPSTRHRLPSIDALRGLTIIWVAAWHFRVDSMGIPPPDTAASAAFSALARADIGRAAVLGVQSLFSLAGFRLEVLLFVTGLVLMMGRRTSTLDFLGRRARNLLPNYWLGSLAAVGVLVGLAGLRAWLLSAPLLTEIHSGSLLAREAYRFEWADILRSLTVVGRLENGRTMQVVSPSLWYIVLIGQLYVVFPWLRALLDRFGAWKTLAASTVFMLICRYLALRHPGLPDFDPGQALAYALPCRLAAPVAGMIAARWVSRAAAWPSLSPGALATALVPASALVVAGIWLAGVMSSGPTFGFLAGPTLSMLVGLPGLLLVAACMLEVPGLGRLLRWTGQRSFSLLVAQDLLRFVTGTLLATGVPMAGLTPYAMPVYIALALGVTAVWDPLQARFGLFLWPQSTELPDEITADAPLSWSGDLVRHSGAVHHARVRTAPVGALPPYGPSAERR